MSLTRKFLSAMGIESDKIDEIIDAHMETVNSLKAERDDLKANADELASVKKELEEAKKTIDSSGSDEFKGKFEALSKEFKDYKAGIEAKELEQTKTSAYKAMLKDAGISEKRIDAILKVTDLSALEMDGDKLKDLEALANTAKEEWKDFLVTENKAGAGTNNPPAGDEGARTPIAIPSIF